MTTNNEAVKGEEAAPLLLYSPSCRQWVFSETQVPVLFIPGTSVAISSIVHNDAHRRGRELGGTAGGGTRACHRGSHPDLRAARGQRHLAGGQHGAHRGGALVRSG